MRKTPDLTGGSGLLHQAQGQAPRSARPPLTTASVLKSPFCEATRKNDALIRHIRGDLTWSKGKGPIFSEPIPAPEGSGRFGNLGFRDVSMASSSALASSA